MISAGIDIGSRTTKAVLWDGERIVSKSLVPTGWNPEQSSESALQKASGSLKRAEIAKIIATGYGRVTTKIADKTITEITAHARGVASVLPDTKTLIDIGGQDSKAIILEEGGLVSDFAMNDRCAAGSGKFLEFLAMTMNMSIQEFAELAYTSRNPTQISSICTVFAESEVLSLLAEGAEHNDVACGVHRSIAARVAQMVNMLHPAPPAAFSGGVAHNRCLIRELANVMNMEILVPDNPEYMGALGAAIMGMQIVK